MLAVEISTPGGPEVLTPVDRPKPAPGRGEVLIAVAAAGVNRPDVMQRQGKYPPPPGASDLPGLEVAGTVAACGADVDRWRIGDAVCALVPGGGYAEYCVAPAAVTLPIPSGVDAMSAAALPETYFTVWTNVFERGRLSEGERLLVHGGSSGIGTTAIQLASAFGAHVFATAGTPDKCAACERLGAERAINYREEDFVEVVADATGGAGVDVVLDMVGGDYTPRNIKALAPDGRLVQIAILAGPKATINWIPIMQKRLVLTGSTLRPRPVEEKAAIAQALHRKVWPILEQGRARPVIHATFPLRAAAEAHTMLEAGAHIGKIVLLSQPTV
ncbi:MAG: NAD(P)H-quinone oxidoreductase [Vicinamibacterales bacterium]|jgi:putative PIG3 family NAD(P)H quinone oxidoreductase|nr:NAD(P)H-quinone oxidoreductase [Acidobacteriota bacterium]MDP7295730.1 NAD(P)H-quinone oxidoreductase [Vicinamibacterales bacterium]MDP7471484.1 NAD(P)H-quinone oxidoreductase [Vicinamibacterales bacterium]MDP7670318.1 NAD(P)H-quinone oxidoreductase [Vicinamibacterales bacterium]HJO37975.1 NAD(P)H-quinone oxidoreductase [Vicinamibacterales bacterium]|tara:strand:+ start:21278 stop:22267 length:990 start_codon:yes stop_codon:yes gene_type:complete